jgi:geranylgeranyl diphosphate synthase type II
MPAPAEETGALDVTSLGAFLGGVSGWIEGELARLIPPAEPRELLYDLARDYPARGGKRFRPALLVLACALAGGPPRRALPSAVALELFQNFALVHDDIEDDSQVRRGRPALHRLHGVPLALNAGDLLFGLVHEALLENEAPLGAELALAVHRRFAAVFRRTFEGQALDIGWIARDHFPSRAEFERMIRLKTAWYSGRGPCEIGALIGGGDAALQRTLGDFGERLGIGFQVRDDLLNLTADSAGAAPGLLAGGYGKERGGDIAEGKRTLIAIELLERLAPAEGARLRAILTKPPPETSPAEIGWAIAQAERTGALAAVRDHCRAQGLAALELLRPLPPSPHKALFEELARYLVQEREA